MLRPPAEDVERHEAHPATGTRPDAGHPPGYPDHVGSDHLREALKLVAVLLKEAGVPFALAGSYGLWARGGPEPDHDVDFMIAEEDAPRVEDVLAESGLESVRMPVLPATVLMAGDNPFARALLGLLAALGVAPATHDHTATSDSGKE
ncbi:hypothetical protein GCM10009788_29410 [Nocardioides humi]|uniref:Nucleotidyltransferase domain-containing protein n=1 Tax=Nocardioides humi TaxID=449461 RepID=A0ABN2AP62_9ACTN